MSLTLYVQLLSLVLVLNADSCSGAVPSCKFRWFDSTCRYRCNCLYDDYCYYTNGECIGSLVCKDGWFGPACQYVNLVTTSRTASTPAWIYDFPDTQCNPGQDTVTVSLNTVFYFTWLRLRVNSSEPSQDFKLQLIYANGSIAECSNMYILKITDTTLDVHCQPGVFFQQLNITGAGVKSLCSVYISGGRNVALGQETTQSSTYDDRGYSTHAVDGDTNPVYSDGSCTHTKNDTHPYWKLTFALSHQVHRYVIYNRNGLDEQKRLWRFSLEAYQNNNIVAFKYTDPTFTNHDIYRIQSDTPQIPVSSVTVFAGNPYDLLLTLCEVEMFGDTVCDAGLYGRECKNKCNCARDEQCFVSTGGCPSGCAAGYHGERCQTACSASYYGENCARSCSPNCADQLCNATNGICQSCVIGKSGLDCDEACPPTKFGQYCRLTCSLNCSSRMCDSVTGKCASCVRGSAGDFCEQTVPVNEEDESPPVAAIVGPVVAVVVLIALIVGGVFIWRKYKHIKNNQGQTSSRSCIESGKSSAVKSQPLQAVTGQATLSVLEKSIVNQDSTDISHNGPGYYNFVPGLNENLNMATDQESSTIENGEKYQQPIKSVLANNNIVRTAAGILDHHTYDTHTNSCDIILYEIPTASTAVIHKSQQLKSEEGLANASGITDNPYESIDDTTPSPYDEITDI